MTSSSMMSSMASVIMVATTTIITAMAAITTTTTTAAAADTTMETSDSRRGHGFRPIFLGLANLQGSLRFRSGDHALLIDGTSPDLATAQLEQKPLIDGFLASIRCHVSLQGAPR